jgi:TRAP-type transport system periplasmic protein
VRLNRRTLMVAAAALGASTLSAPHLARAQTTRLKISHYLPPMHQINTALVAWAAELREKSEGEIVADVFPAGQMGPPPRQFDLARTGVSDASFFFPSLTPGRFPLSDTFLMPFMFNQEGSYAPTPAAQASAITTSLSSDIEAEYPGTKILFTICTEVGGFFMREKEIRTPADLNGLRMRPTGPMTGAHLEAWGASLATIPPAELSDAIAKGVVDGAIFNFEGGRAFQLAQSVRTVTLLNHSVGFFVMTMNQGVYDALPEAHRTLVDETTGVEAARRIGALYDAAEAEGREYMIAAGVEVHTLEPTAVERFASVLAPVTERQLDALEEQGMMARDLAAKIKEQVAAL